MKLNEKILSAPKLFSRENDIIQWGIDRNIIGDNAQATFEGQQEKTKQEWEEWKQNHSQDDIGDIWITLVMQCALKGTTVSKCVKTCFDDFEKFIDINRKSLLESCEDRLDSDLKSLLKMSSQFTINLSYVIVALYMTAEKYGWTLEDCIEVAWNDIKDRKGKMVHGMFIKQCDLDSLAGYGVNVVDGFGEVYFEGKGRQMTLNSYEAVMDIFNKLSLKTSFFEDMKYIRTVGRI